MSHTCLLLQKPTTSHTCPPPQPGTKGHPSFNSTPPRIPYAAYVAHSGEGPGKGFMASSTTSHLNYMHKHEIRVPFPSSLQTSLAKTLLRGTRPAASCLLHYILPTGQKPLAIFRLTIGLHPKGICPLMHHCLSKHSGTCRVASLQGPCYILSELKS
jgi:hypothetical protein